MNIRSIFSALLVLTATPQTAVAFPTMVKHGYTTCITCHFSPSGGGLLNSYGKYVAGELFGRYNTSETALKWLTSPEEEKLIHAGIFLRASQTYFESSNIKRAKPERMQADLEIVATKNQFFAAATAGFRGTSALPGQSESDAHLRSFYLGARDFWYAIRAGRFFPEFGIRGPNHNWPTRKGLYWNHNEEPYLIQASYLEQAIDASVAVVRGADGTKLAGKDGYTATLAYKTGRSRTGLSILEAKKDQDHSSALSVFTLLGYEDRAYLMTEIAKKTERKTSESISWLTTFEAGLEISKGIIPFLGFESTASSTIANGVQGAQTVTRFYPVGIRFYPYTHFELQAQYASGQQISTSGTENVVFAFLMGNVYF